MSRQQSLESIAPVTIRHLDDIQEVEPSQVRASRSTIACVSLIGVGCLIAVGFMLKPGSAAKTGATKPDLLGDLVAGKHQALPDPPAAKVAALPPPPPTLPAAAKPVSPAASAPPPAMPWEREGPGRLPFTPAPINTDVLPRLDRAPPFPLQQPRPWPESSAPPPPRRAASPSPAQPASAGKPGGYQLQVSSLQSQSDALSLADSLRRRGHRAHVQSVIVKGKGRWHRVRVGPFASRRSAISYQREFEQTERMSTFIARPAKPVLKVTSMDDKGRERLAISK